MGYQKQNPPRSRKKKLFEAGLIKTNWLPGGRKIVGSVSTISLAESDAAKNTNRLNFAVEIGIRRKLAAPKPDSWSAQTLLPSTLARRIRRDRHPIDV